MADLRARFATLDALPAPDLWAEVERRAAASAVGSAARVRSHGPVWRGTEPTVAASRRLVLVLVLLGLLTVALLGSALVGGLLPDLLRGVAPATVAPSVAVAVPATPDTLPEGFTALPACPDGPVPTVAAGPLPEVGPPVSATGIGRIAMAGDFGVFALDPAADPAPVFGMAPPLARFQYDPLVSSMAWSPDGRWLAFVATGGVVFGSSPRQVFCQDVFVVGAEGGVAVNLTRHSAWTGVTDVAWSSDGRWLAYAAVDAADAGDIFDPPLSPAPDPARGSIQVVRVDDDIAIAERRRVWSGHAVGGPTWSTRGELAFATGPDGHLALLAPGETAAREDVAWAGIGVLSWAPDGDRLLLLDGEGRLVVHHAHGSGAPRTQELWAPGPPQPGGSAAVRRYLGHPPVWAPDGQAVAATIISESEFGRDAEIVSITAGEAAPTIRSLLSVDQDIAIPMGGPATSPDGKLLAYTLDGVTGDDAGVWVMKTDGTEPRRISALLSLGSSGPGAWQPLP